MRRAQARLIARLWGSERTIPVNLPPDAQFSTAASCARHGWLAPVAMGALGEPARRTDGTMFAMHEVSPAGLAALRDFLIKETREDQ